MPLGLGATKGLAFTEDWKDDINNVYRDAEENARMQKDTEQKTQYYAGLMKQTQVNIPSVDARLTDYYKGVNNELADFAIANPHFETDINGMQKFINITDKYHNNPIIAEGEQSKAEFNKLRDAVASGTMRQSDANREMARWTDYAQNGSKDDSPFVFMRPKQFTPDDIFEEGAKAVQPRESNTLSKTFPGMILSQQYIPDGSALTKANELLSDPDYKDILMNDYNNVIAKSKENPSKDNPDLTGLYPNAAMYVAQQIKNRHNLSQRLQSDPALTKMLEQKEGEKDVNNSFFKTDLMARESGLQPGGKVLAKTPDLAFTVYGGLNQQTTISGDNVLISNSKNQLVPIPKAVTGKPISVNEIINSAGQHLLKTTFNFTMGRTIGTTNTDNTDELFTKDELTDMGAVAVPRPTNQVDVLATSLGTNVQIKPGETYQMSTYAKMNYNDENVLEYEAQSANKSHMGSSYMNKIAEPLRNGANDLIQSSPEISAAQFSTRYNLPILPGMTNLKQIDPNYPNRYTVDIKGKTYLFDANKMDPQWKAPLTEYK